MTKSGYATVVGALSDELDRIESAYAFDEDVEKRHLQIDDAMLKFIADVGAVDVAERIRHILKRCWYS